ncbi:MAG: ribonuclease HII [Dehalococcoidales bacterium]|nr:ribonuclease HII [Dehalococcoidales bacterium]
MQKPSFAEETILKAQGYHYIAGIDEAGRGALAGPVIAAAVILPCQIDAPWLGEVNDSKQLKPARREFLFYRIYEAAISIGVGEVSPQTVDKDGIINATQLAMKRAVDQLSPPAEFLLIDYMHLTNVPLPQKGITYGDCLCFSIACASIIAKVSRNRLMIECDEIYPGYGLAQHKGYGTKHHLDCLRRLNPSAIHRYSFRPVKDMIEKKI